MKVAHYVGNHAADGLLARAGYAITRKVQKGPYAEITHCEVIHAEYDDGSVTIASSSFRDGGVRSKRVTLNPANWIIVDVPLWDVDKSVDLLFETAGEKYNIRGAIATVFIGSPERGKWFCNEWCAYPYVKASATFGPHQFAAICLTLGHDITTDFFACRPLLK